MCTVSFVPLDSGSYAITSNRDERSNRLTRDPVLIERNGQKLHFPQDMESGGTWIATSDEGRTCCLLNGAFETHKRKPAYSRSRGQVLLEMFDVTSVLLAIESMDLHGVEPFTLVILDLKGEAEFYELRWDEKKKHIRHLPLTEPRIWSSATLYNAGIRAEREAFFNNWRMTEQQPSAQGIVQFHAEKKGMAEQNDLIMSRENGIRTLSITQVVADKDGCQMIHLDLLKEKETRIDIKRTTAHV